MSCFLSKMQNDKLKCNIVTHKSWQYKITKACFVAIKLYDLLSELQFC